MKIDDFLCWMSNDVNPQRIRLGLEHIPYSEALRWFEILNTFHLKMEKDKKVEGVKKWNRK